MKECAVGKDLRWVVMWMMLMLSGCATAPDDHHPLPVELTVACPSSFPQGDVKALIDNRSDGTVTADIEITAINPLASASRGKPLCAETISLSPGERDQIECSLHDQALEVSALVRVDLINQGKVIRREVCKAP